MPTVIMLTVVAPLVQLITAKVKVLWQRFQKTRFFPFFIEGRWIFFKD
jgi:hypothetical protein